MPQLDTSSWLVTILGLIITLFIIFQLKTKNFVFTPQPSSISTKTSSLNNPWENKWTKIFLPLSLPPLT